MKKYENFISNCLLLCALHFQELIKRIAFALCKYFSMHLLLIFVFSFFLHILFFWSFELKLNVKEIKGKRNQKMLIYYKYIGLYDCSITFQRMKWMQKEEQEKKLLHWNSKSLKLWCYYTILKIVIDRCKSIAISYLSVCDFSFPSLDHIQILS